MHVDINPLVSTMWYDGGENVGTTEMYEMTLELEEHFPNAASSAIHSIPYSVRFDGSHDRNSAYNALMLGMARRVNPIYLYLLYLRVSLHRFEVCQSFRFFPSLFI